MRYPASEKLEIIRIVEQSHLPAKRTLDKLGIARRTFYRWYDRYLAGGPEALEDRPSAPSRVWNRIAPEVQDQIVEMALDYSELSPRELTSRAFLTNNKVKVATSKLRDGQGNYLGYGPEGVFAGERVEFSGNVPSNLTKGTGTNLSAVLCGDWSQLLIGYWSAFDLLVNPYESTAYAKGNVSVRAMLTCDIAVRYAEAFAASTDVVA